VEDNVNLPLAIRMGLVYKHRQRIAMIFCKKCGRYNQDGQATCATCGADLKSAGHASFKGGNVKVSTAPQKPTILPVPSSETKTPNITVNTNIPTTSVITIPEPLPPSRDVDSIFKHDKFLLRQKALTINEKYYVQDENGNPLMFVERPALLTQQLIMLAAVAAVFFGGTWAISAASEVQLQQLGPGLNSVAKFLEFLAVLATTAYVFVFRLPKRHVEFFTDDTKTHKVLEVKQLNKIEFPFANFAILDSSGNVIGKLRKNALFDYIRRRWYVMNGNGLHLCTAKEDSIILSFFRRTGIPIFAFMRTNFIFLRGQSIVGQVNRKFTIRDRYVLDMTSDFQQSIDRRIAVATGVMLDTGERR
jgi:uncharacterized protein YxjI